MLFSFFESVKYVGLMFPVALLRVFLGYFYLQQALAKFHSDYLVRPRLASTMAENLSVIQIPVWYKNFIEDILIPHWQTVAFVFTGLEFAIAISYLIGYVVRPMGLLAALFTAHLLLTAGAPQADFFRLLLACHLTMSWLGAGRCLGLDYYFYKRVRGLWW